MKLEEIKYLLRRMFVVAVIAVGFLAICSHVEDYNERAAIRAAAKQN